MRVALLMGGISREREISLKSGERVRKALEKLGYDYVAFDVKEDFLEKISILKEFDVVFNVLHGKFGEDGSLQSILDFLGVRYTGSDAFSSMVCFDKLLTYRFLKDFVKIPTFTEINKPLGSSPVGYPCVVKPRREGSSIGVFICETEEEFQKAVEEDLRRYGSVIVQEYVPGREITVSIIETEKGFEVLPLLELRPKKRRFYDFIAKYTKGETEFLLPAPLEPQEVELIKRASLSAFVEAGCRGFGRVDGIFYNGDFYFLEINTVPGLTELSDLPASAKAAGIEFEELIDIVIRSAFLKGE
ncbi:D-alanine--D-alanine ligase [Thermotoga sp. KOL6]|uniref:D-alanine--D-alanine ligase n=1 Tax=Thermotoga sp. KOL6 TaxID=126741 RepID=UPI000C768C3A|nr:D-alanine--D-alanine ligase [Thermotoga sp. KOL6]PLV59013.1 D-alanyl-alanine synthetase A [Thermotoga sp. KOL6]